MSDEFCSSIPGTCVELCASHVACMRQILCERETTGNCDELSQCDNDEEFPESCKNECSVYAPCFICENSCDFAGDEECDDGGDGSAYNACPPGSDCRDCGARVVERHRSPPPTPDSANSFIPCEWTPSSCRVCEPHAKCLQYIYCALTGADVCEHIGAYSGMCADAPRVCLTQCALFSHCFICEDTCDFNTDSECDDGGQGAEFASCPPGSDCTDCGPRGSSFLDWATPSPPMPLAPPPDPYLPPPSAPPSPLPPLLPTLSPSMHPLSKSTGMDGGAVFGVILLIMAGIGGIGYAVLWYRRRQRRMAESLTRQTISTQLDTSAPLESNARYVPPT